MSHVSQRGPISDDGQLGTGFSDVEAVGYSEKGLWCRGRKESLLYMGSKETGRK